MIKITIVVGGVSSVKYFYIVDDAKKYLDSLVTTEPAEEIK